MHYKALTATGAALILLAGCSRQDEGNDNLAGPDTQIAGNIVTPDDIEPASGQDTNAAPPPSSADNGVDIPPMIRGRWGIVPGDCTSTHGDAKGLMEVSPKLLTFYESRGTLQKIKEHEPSRIRADFSFEGEGMSWNREMTLDVQDSGQTLIRTEYGKDAALSPLRYKRCAD